MDQEFERKRRMHCMTKTKQGIVFVPEIASYKRRRKYKCEICNHFSWFQGERPPAESVCWSFYDQRLDFFVGIAL